MPVEVWTNDGLGTVTSGGTTAPGAGTPETWTVTATNAFPVAATGAAPPTQFYVCDQSASFATEKILVTVAPGGTGAGQTWTVTRGADGTTPLAHTASFTIVQVVTRASLQVLQRPWLVRPSGDATGATDPVNVHAILSAYGVAELAPGTFYGNATVIGHEGQYVRGARRQVTFWNLTTTGIPAFQWTPANSSVFSTHGTGGVTGVTITGQSGTVNPADGSIGAQMDSIYLLESDIEVINCQYGLLQSNQYFWSEGGRHFLVANGCTNPVVWQCAATGGASRTGSFDRSELTVVHVDTLNGSYGNGGVQLLAGAQILGGKIKQIGNYGGTGQAADALAVTGSLPISPFNASSIGPGTTIEHALEYDGTGTQPGTVLVGGGSFIQAGGTLDYVNFGVSSLTGSSPWQFSGPVAGDNTLISKQWQSITSGFPAGWSGSVIFRNNLSDAGEVMLQVILSVTNGTVITFGETICTLPAAFTPGNFKSFACNFYNGAAVTLDPFQLASGTGALQYVGAGFTAGATAQFSGQFTYTLVI